jgi:hypothetical protein
MTRVPDAPDGTATIACAPMTAATRAAAQRLLGGFLGTDAHYRASANAYGDGGPEALAHALDLFLARPELGFVWLAQAGTDVAGAWRFYARHGFKPLDEERISLLL